jgi:hypothetical protein
MPPKGTKPTNDELLAQFDDLGVDTETDQQPTPRPAATVKSEQDILAELDSLASQRPSSGHGTPQVSSKSPKLTSDASSSGRPSEEKTTVTSRSEENGRTSHSDVEFVPSAAEKKLESSGGGWWGGILSTATAAMKQAEAAVKEIQKNEEAQKWAEQVRGNVGALRDLGIYNSSSQTIGACRKADSNICFQAASYGRSQSQRSHLSSIPWLLLFRLMNAFKSTSLMTSLVILV